MSSPIPVPEIAVRGEAVLRVEPEIADVDVTVHGRARERHTALERCRVRQAEVSGVLTAAGDALESVETTGVAVHQEIGEAGRTTAVASMHTRVTVARFDILGDLLMALGELDDVEVFGPLWRLRPESPVVAEARLAAVRDAVQRARQYARAFGAELTALVAVSDAGLSGGSPRFASPAAAMAPFEASGPAFDLAPAHQEVRGVVEVRFAMSPPDQEVFRG